MRISESIVNVFAAVILTFVLMMISGLVIGTTDLSELFFMIYGK